ncbi:MAG: 2-acyl-glycerophospho-ethanolamine acyltransferase [Chlamydiales bacterium]|jgi:long-chain-fatty-acid--[acyl-carrier-protein] ligase|nr:2-acyl-glycerophospho-ethanolamine acyltransferase [Chlamydiales bacterium]
MMQKSYMKTSDWIYWINRFIIFITYSILRLRYKIELKGFDKIEKKEGHGILFLPNHPALIDPVIVMSLLYAKFYPHSLADESQVNRPILGPVTRHFGTRTIPSLEKVGIKGAHTTQAALKEIIADLKNGENVLLYPSGHLKSAYKESLGASSAVESLVKSIPDLRIVLIKQNGLWGSRFSAAFSGRKPLFLPTLFKCIKYLLLNALFFMPRRRISLEFIEPMDFPRNADRWTMNRYMEEYYNKDAQHNTYVAYGFWEKEKEKQLPDPEQDLIEGDTREVPEETKKIVLEKLYEVTGKSSIKDTDSLAYDLSLDSLAIAEIHAWVEKEFGFSLETPEALKTVGDILLVASGKGVSHTNIELKDAPEDWTRRHYDETPLRMPAGDTIADVFLNQAKARFLQVIIADHQGGAKSYKDIITGILALKPVIEKLQGEYIGIMLPASVGADTLYLATLFAGKIPVMINWTMGERNLLYAVNLLGVKQIITSKLLLDRLAAQGTDLACINDRFVLTEGFKNKIGPLQKLWAALQAHVCWRSLYKASIKETAVVLFTSGSESFPKAVPLSHQNLLSNIRDLNECIHIKAQDALLGFLPPFHSFGITITTLLPLCLGLRTVYHPNPTASLILAKLINTYKLTLVLGTPTFIDGILRVAKKGKLDSLRLIGVGAEKCPERIYKNVEQNYPHILLVEGYGTTECSPVISFNRVENPVPYSIGLVLPSMEYAIQDIDAGSRVRQGERGMLLVRGPNVFAGYLKHQGSSPFIQFEGKDWYQTGDLVSEDEKGALHFQGRLKRFVKLGGEMISLPAIEEILQQHLQTPEDAGAVVAVEAKNSEEQPELILFTTKQVGREVVNQWLRQAGMSPLNNIRKIVVIPEIPILGAGKIDYQSLKRLTDPSPA